MRKVKVLQDNWVGISKIKDEFGVGDGTIERWARLHLIRRMPVEQGSTKWLYDRAYFKEVFCSLRIRDEKTKMSGYKKYGRKLAAMEKEIERFQR